MRYLSAFVAMALALAPMDSAAQHDVAAPDRSAMRADEAGVWRESDRAELSARSSGRLIRDEALSDYIEGVACRVMPTRCTELRFYVMSVPVPNAFMSPNGYSEVWSGILLRLEDEAQLAFLLSHEGAHYTELHSIEHWRALRGRANIALVASAAVAVAGVATASNYPEAAGDILDATGNLIDAIHLVTIASIFGFSRENETEADLLGIDRVVAAGYSAASGIRFWSNSISDRQASDNPDVRRVHARPNVFNTHPLDERRVEALTRRTQNVQGEGETNRERYRAAIRPFLDAWLRAELRTRDFGQTARLLDRLGAHGEDLGIVEYYRGEINRIRRGAGDRERAVQHYTNSIAYPDAPAAAWRELGEYAARDGRSAEAVQFFGAYLERAADAGDRALIQSRIAELSGGQP